MRESAEAFLEWLTMAPGWGPRLAGPLLFFAVTGLLAYALLVIISLLLQLFGIPPECMYAGTGCPGPRPQP